ncbi:hypothetical protein QQF64_035399 [Cirrhinus molitorella]|uniref:Uncharacterized protein n=1 Tax=Cirrhinus molitorella TaxID=172907 RepID=A0ABR3NG06_9TELE
MEDVTPLTFKSPSLPVYFFCKITSTRLTVNKGCLDPLHHNSSMWTDCNDGHLLMHRIRDVWMITLSRPTEACGHSL